MCASSTQTSTLAQIRRPTTTTHPKAGDAYILPGINLKATPEAQQMFGGHGCTPRDVQQYR